MIRTNKLEFSFDINAIAVKYDFFRIETTETYLKSGALILDAPLLENNTCAVRFDSRKSLLVMMHHGDDNKTKLKQALANVDGFDAITLKSVNVSEIKKHEMAQLLLNAMSCYDLPELRFNNLTGHLYCFHPKLIKKGKGAIWQVPCLELRVVEDMILTLNIRTFTSGKLQKNITFKKKKYHDYPKYVFSSRNTLRRKLAEDNEDEFILRQVDGEKNDIGFLDTKSLNGFRATKMGVLACVIESFNENYEKIAHIEFAQVIASQCIDHDLAAKKSNKKAVKQALKQPIRLVDQINDEHSEDFLKRVQKVLNGDEWGIDAVIGHKVLKDSLNIVLIHDADYYEGMDDPHSLHYDATVQHITREKYDGDSKFTAKAIIHELLIKEDIRNRKISLFNWNELDVKGDVSFGTKVTDDENESRYFFMTVHPDGTFDIKEETNDLFSQSRYASCMEIFDRTEFAKENVKGIVMDTYGNINVIKDTGWITIPEIIEIKKELEAGNNKLRSKAKREDLLSSCLDIKSFRVDNTLYYFVGTIGEGMKYAIHNAANIRRIEPYNGAPEFFEKLLPLMNVSFVKNEQLTVMPFPFKYLREWVSAKECLRV